MLYKNVGKRCIELFSDVDIEEFVECETSCVKMILEFQIIVILCKRLRISNYCQI